MCEMAQRVVSYYVVALLFFSLVQHQYYFNY